MGDAAPSEPSDSAQHPPDTGGTQHLDRASLAAALVAAARPPEPPGAADAEGLRPSYTMEKEQSRAVRAYRSNCSEATLLGTLAITSEHKLSDVLQMLKDELGIQTPVTLYRGCGGEQLRVPLPAPQYQRKALPFFPSEAHHLLVEQR